jgi:hypothetical protein
MNKQVFGITIWNEFYGKVVDEDFVDNTQFTIFLKAIKGCLDLGRDLTYFTGTDFLVHIPFDVLKKSVIFTKLNEVKFEEIIKSRAEAITTKDK